MAKLSCITWLSFHKSKQTGVSKLMKELLGFFILGIQMHHLWLFRGPWSPKQWEVVIVQSGLKAETVLEVRLMVKYHPRLETSSAATKRPWGLWVLPDKQACLYWWQWLTMASKELWVYFCNWNFTQFSSLHTHKLIVLHRGPAGAKPTLVIGTHRFRVCKCVFRLNQIWTDS